MTRPLASPHFFATPAAANKAEYNVALGYLRAFVVVLVIAHHAALAYHPFAPAPHPSLTIQPHWWEAFPIVDAQRSGLFALLVGFNDIFFMALMFFLSGLFVWSSIHRKGVRIFLRDRLLRLGVPFVIAAGVLAPFAYYPAYLQTGATAGLPGFWRQWLSLGEWPAGPAWFIWVLLVFDCVAAALLTWVPRWIESIGSLTAKLSPRPVALFALLVAVSAVAYVPMTWAFSPIQWSNLGPFAFQTTRIFHYLVYFLIAVGLGADQGVRSLVSAGGKLSRRWPLWTICALFAFTLTTFLSIAVMTSHIGSRSWATFANLGFVLSCAASCFALLAIFARFAKTHNRIFDSLSQNSYGIYLLHYLCVSWLQYALLTAHIPALVKGTAVLMGALALSWAATASFRSVAAVRRVL